MPVVCTVITCNFLDFFIYLFFHSNGLVIGSVLFRFPTCQLFWSHDVAVPDHGINTTVQHWQTRHSDGFHYRFPVLFVDLRFTKRSLPTAGNRSLDDYWPFASTQRDARMMIFISTHTERRKDACLSHWMRVWL